MTALLVVLMFVGFALLDVLVRMGGRRIEARALRREREAALTSSLRLDFAAEAPSLKRVEVRAPQARILAVDDEPVVLDSFRKILVLAGFSVDTVENGPEALGLVQRHDYDFVFSDLKMPDMDGVEVVKAVKHLRPDVDVAVITGYGTIETAVETMQYGAVDYVQKPFTEDELLAFARKLLLRRQARIDAQRQPAVRVVSPEAAKEPRPHEYYVAGGAFYAPGHTWARIEPSGRVRAGLDDFARRALGRLEAMELPAVGEFVKRGDVLFAARRGGASARFRAPVSGKVVDVNALLARRAGQVTESPYDEGWICLLQPSELSAELKHLRIGQAAVDWYQEELTRLRGLGAEAMAGELDWSRLEQDFLSVTEGVPTGEARGRVV
jgi:CheY-like chemotaxis protein